MYQNNDEIPLQPPVLRRTYKTKCSFPNCHEIVYVYNTERKGGLCRMCCRKYRSIALIRPLLRNARKRLRHKLMMRVNEILGIEISSIVIKYT